MTIHSQHPFDDGRREAARQLRGRLGSRVCLLTAGGPGQRAGWTVSAALIVDGDPWRVLALVDPDSDLCELAESTTRCALHLLSDGQQYLADAFAGLAPAPGGPFRLADWEQSTHGPRLAGAENWALLTLESAATLGWSRQLVFTVDEAHAGADPAPLHHLRGRYRSLPSA
ncbi:MULTISPECIES: flavin reductase family protein [unclassified Luteococcus]|uniref:flavin reductase family protein n=1 Tax=unclassified Luteococcus TaxID=2639923 RepID=UPI00313CA349